MSDAWTMGDLARLDAMPDVGDPLIPSGPQVSEGVPWANRLTDRLPKAVMGGLAEMVKTPGALMTPNPYPAGSEEADFYDATKKQAATDWAGGMALNTMGTGAVDGVTVKGAEAVLGAGLIRRDPSLWSPLSDIKLNKPLSEMEHRYTDVRI